MAAREEERTEAWRAVGWGSKSLVPRRGREEGVLGGLVGLNGEGDEAYARVPRKRKSGARPSSSSSSSMVAGECEGMESSVRSAMLDGFLEEEMW